MKIWICTDMEGLGGVDSYAQCYPSGRQEAGYLEALEELTIETNAAVSGAFDGGATEVWVLDGHGFNNGHGFTSKLDGRARVVPPLQPGSLWEGLDAETSGVVIIGQHAKAGTQCGFLTHTESIEQIQRYRVNGHEAGELEMLALYAGGFGVPVLFASGDEALCREARELLPRISAVATKTGLSWDRCRLYDVAEVRQRIRAEVTLALGRERRAPLRYPPPFILEIEYKETRHADALTRTAAVRRINARPIRWQIEDARDIFLSPMSASKSVISSEE